MLAAAGGPPLERMPIDEARKASRHMNELGGVVEPIAQVDDLLFPGPVYPVPVRIYRPTLAEKLPALVFFHGGGFVLCDLESHDRQCRSLANASGCMVIAVDYRLAPEHPFPAAAEDAYAATCHVAEHAGELGVDPARIAVGGDSAGANLATVVSLMARDRSGPSIRFQMLVYPVTDWNDASPSMREYEQNHFLSRDVMDWFKEQYLPDKTQRTNPYASPMYARDLRGLPPAMLATAECDPLRDQGEAYGRRLQSAGVSVLMRRYEGMIHPFFSLGSIVDGANVLMADCASALRQSLVENAPARV
jgi:acetyl esterase